MNVAPNNSRIDFSFLVSPRRDKDKPIYRWHSYKHSFSKELVDNFIEEFKLNEDSMVLDPFVGSGTTLLACKDKKISGIGYDISPFAVFLTKTKLRNYNKNELIEALKIIASKKRNGTSNKSYDFPDIPLLKKAYKKNIWNEILSIRDKIFKIKNQKNRNFFLLALFSILESVSNTTKSGGFLRITQRDVKKKMVLKKFLESASSMINDLENKKVRGNGTILKTFVGDARKLKTKDKFDAIITSPPYMNRHDYTRIYSLELILNFVKNNSELKNLRYKTLRSHVEARKRYSANGYKKPVELNQLLKKIKSNGVNNIQIVDMIEGYFEDMYLAIKEMKNVLRRSGKIALVVSNVRFSGINIPVDEILGRIGENIGLNLIEIRIARFRGNSSQQMRDYKRSNSRESIIIWGN